MCKDKNTEAIVNPKKLYSKNNRVRVILDFDDVIAAFLRAVIKAYNEQNGTNFKPADMSAWDLTKSLNCTLDDLYSIFRAPGFFENLEPKRGAVGAIRELINSTRYDLYIVTATSDDDGSELQEKLRWLKKYLPEFNRKRIISCQDKEIIRADVIVDDKVENLQKCSPYMFCILMDSPTNKDCNEFVRISRLKELPSLLDEIFYNNDKGIKHFQKEVEPAIIEAQNDPNKEVKDISEEVKIHYSRKVKGN
jgi:5'(3')-deoxyribonucleotidase